MIATGQVVKKPVKVDLHIHSAASAHKDGRKVKDGTVDNIGILLKGLEDNEVNMAAITDHDAFDYTIYEALRNRVDGAQHLQKVLPGVEFTVSFKTPDGDTPVHVITLFDDSNQDLVKGIASAIPTTNGKPDYDAGSAFSEDRYWNIIRHIGLDIVTIAHQKTSPSSNHKGKNDANNVGDELFQEFVRVEYFEAYEYKNRRNELFNKSYAYTHDEQERLRFITGSDCHVWSAYPHYDTHPNPADREFAFTYLKCLPTFKGLAMAVTDLSRIKTVPSFFSVSHSSLDSIELTLNGDDLSIPLSPGINAIIGDNSIGKSSFLNALAGFNGIGTTVKKGQEKYLASRGLSLRTSVAKEDVLQFDGQESIRKNFEGLSKGKAKNQLEKHFPSPVDPAPYKSYAIGQFEQFSQALKASCEYQKSLEALSDYTIPENRPLDAPQSITFDNTIELKGVTAHSGLIDDLSNAKIQLANAANLHADILTEEDIKDLGAAKKAIERIVGRHQAIIDSAKLEERIVNKLLTAIKNLEAEQSNVITDAQKAQAEYQHAIDRIGNAITAAVKHERLLHDFVFDFAPMPIKPNTNLVGTLQFVCKLSTEEISPKLLSSLIDGLIGKRKKLDTLNSSYQDVIDAINKYPDDDDDPLSVLATRFEAALDEKLSPAKSIIREGDDVYDELSQGYNAQMYFALMADPSIGNGIYIVDQPEDQISQKAIKESVLREFRDIAGSRQVILITHNPQFIVNLDVDNVIFIGQKEGKLYIQSGALEYETDDFSILQIVADNIEGGMDTIQRRMKRYEKAS